MAISAAQDILSGFGRSSADQDFERMYQRHAEDVFRYALLVLRSRADAEDVTQATFLRAYRAISNGERVRKSQHWLITIAHNECRRHLRNASRRSIEVELDEGLVCAPEPVGGPTAEEIRDALEQLSFNQRAALVMRELEDRSYAEIAEVLELSTSAVETLLFRGRRAMREQMEGAVPCEEVEGLLLRQLDGEIGPDERRVLRAHTRSCPTCATLERQHRGRKAALKRLGSMITLPSSLGSFFGGGMGAAVATGAGVVVGAKAVAAVVAVLGVAAAGAATLHPRQPAPVAVHVGRTVADAAPTRVAIALRPTDLRAADVVRAGAGARASVGSTRIVAASAASRRRPHVGNPTIAPPTSVVSHDDPFVPTVAPVAADTPAALATGSPAPTGTLPLPVAVAAVPAPPVPLPKVDAPAPPPVAVPPVALPAVPTVPVPVPAVTAPTVTVPPPPPPPPLPHP